MENFAKKLLGIFNSVVNFIISVVRLTFGFLLDLIFRSLDVVVPLVKVAHFVKKENAVLMELVDVCRLDQAPD